MNSSRQHDSSASTSRARRVLLVLAAGASAVMVAFAASCSDPQPPTGPSGTTTTNATTTTTTAATTTTTTAATTTTTGGTTTTTTTTTTSSPAINYATQIHPQWESEGCTECHDSSHPNLDLAGSPAETCQAIANRDGTNLDLVITGGNAQNSQLIRKPAALVGHAGGLIPCFAQGAACWNVTLDWLQNGAPGPGGVTCDN